MKQIISYVKRSLTHNAFIIGRHIYSHYPGVMNVGFIRGKNGEFQYTAYPVSKSNDRSTVDDISSEYVPIEREDLRCIKCSTSEDVTRGKIKSLYEVPN